MRYFAFEHAKDVLKVRESKPLPAILKKKKLSAPLIFLIYGFMCSYKLYLMAFKENKG